LKVAIMQPYFFPYLGYFQLMSAADHFVIYDDAQYMKGGWVNRNRLLHDGQARWWTRPIERDDFKLSIMQRFYSNEKSTVSLITQMSTYYAHAPHHEAISAFVDETLARQERNVAICNEALLTAVADHLGLRCKFSRASELDTSFTRGQEKVIRICQLLGASCYVNMVGGRALYNGKTFAEAGIDLAFLTPALTPYTQFGKPFVAGLSIVDALMFNDAPTVSTMCEQFTLTDGWS
jgi:hypothetical protein